MLRARIFVSVVLRGENIEKFEEELHGVLLLVVFEACWKSVSLTTKILTSHRFQFLELFARNIPPLIHIPDNLLELLRNRLFSILFDVEEPV